VHVLLDIDGSMEYMLRRFEHACLNSRSGVANDHHHVIAIKSTLKLSIIPGP
jgi:hypothetical protein